MFPSDHEVMYVGHWLGFNIRSI